MSNSTPNDAIDSSSSTHDNERTQEIGMTHSTNLRESTNDSNASNLQPPYSTTSLGDTEAQHLIDPARPGVSSAHGATSVNTNTSASSPAGQASAGNDPRAQTPRPNSHLESWRFDSASGRFVPHVFEGNMAGRPSPSSAPSGADAAQNDTSGDGLRIPEIILQTSTDISVHGPDGQQLPPEASQFLLRMLGAMGGGASIPHGVSAMPGSAAGPLMTSTGPNTSTSQSSPAIHPPQPADPVADGLNHNHGPHAPRSGPSLSDMLRELAMLRERQADPPPDTRRAKQLLRGLPVVSHGLIRRLQRVETLKARAVVQKGETSTEESGELENTLLCLVCYDALLPAKECKGDHAHAADGVGETKDDGMKVDDEGDDMDLDVPTDISPSDSKSSLPLETDNSATKPAPSNTNTNATRRWPYQAPDALIALPCTHVFHATCLKPWFETGKTSCPTCRFDIDPGSDSLDLADWLSPRRLRRQQQREREREQAANGNLNTENATQDSATPTPGAASTTTTPNGNTVNEDNTTAGGAPSGMPSHFSQAIHQAMFSAIARAMGGERAQPPSQPVPTTPAQQGQAGMNPTSNLPPNPTPPTSNGSSNATVPPPSAIPPPPPGFPFELIQELSRTIPSGYSIEGVMFGGSFDIPPADGGLRPLSPTPSGPQRSSSAPPSARMQSTPSSSGSQSSAAQPILSVPSTFSTPSGPARNGPRAPFLSTGLGPNGMSPFGPFSSFLAPPFGPPAPAPAQPPPTPAAGSSTSYFATGSRPSTPSFRHHPYASSRPSTNQANAQARDGEPQAGPADAGPGNGAGRNPNDGLLTTHTISFTFEIPLGSGPPRMAAQNNNATSGTPQDGSTRTNAVPDSAAQAQVPSQDGGAIPPFVFPPGFLFGGGGGGGGMPFGAPFGAPFGSPFGANPFFNSFGPGPGASGGSSRGRRQKKKWAAPEGSSLRSVVEAKERDVGLRCDDVSCFFGPEDEDEVVDGESLDMGVRPERVYLKKWPLSTRTMRSEQDGMVAEEPACAHRLHPECLLVSSRIADQFLNDAIDRADENDTLEAACPICRTRGVLSVPEWRRFKELAAQV